MSAKCKPGRRLVEHVERAAGRAARELGRELDALRLAARERRRRLAHLDVAEADVADRLELVVDARDRSRRTASASSTRISSTSEIVLPLILHFERLRVVALALADFARHVHVGQEVHLDLDDAVALARLAAAAFDVERKPARRVAAHARLGNHREELADVIERAGVRRRIAARRAADRRLIDHDELVELARALDRSVRSARRLAVQMLVERAHQHLVDERRFAAAAHAGDARRTRRSESARRRRAGCWRLRVAHFEPAARLAPAARNRNELASREVRAGLGLGLAMTSSSVPDGEDLAAFGARARPDVDHDVGGAHRVLVVLDDDQRVAEIAQRLAASPAAGRCRADAARSTARRGCTARRPARCRSASPSRMRCDSPPESVVAERASVR